MSNSMGGQQQRVCGKPAILAQYFSINTPLVKDVKATLAKVHRPVLRLASVSIVLSHSYAPHLTPCHTSLLGTCSPAVVVLSTATQPPRSRHAVTF